MTVRLKSEQMMVGTMQTYESLCLVASAALGGKSERRREPPKTTDELEAAMTRALG